MLFLLNDVILTLDLESLSQPAVAASFKSMTFTQIAQLGREMFSESPRLQHVSHSGPTRLATLIVAKKPEINAALFSAPAAGCKPELVDFRFATLGIELIHNLRSYQEQRALNKVMADYYVWGRLQAAVA